MTALPVHLLLEKNIQAPHRFIVFRGRSVISLRPYAEALDE
ncbi:hypothetical protein CI610_01687 [invertebrate metagenome]|uniref:Uncharacterized protein n=1 Tax=invertebrate metagenome TaxID=1711999 RepID=A0A2H9T7W7_9ZZZZ